MLVCFTAANYNEIFFSNVNNYAAWHLARCILHAAVDRGIDEAGVIIL